VSTPRYVLRGVRKVYTSGDVRTEALHGVDLDLLADELVVVLGPSGSGKSSLLNVLGGLDRADAGTVQFRDLMVTGATDAELTDYRRREVGFVFQSYNLIPSLTARENVALGAAGTPNAMSPDDALSMVGLEALGTRFPSELSGGEQQRAAVARAVAKRPAVLLCDEPTGALDHDSGVDVLEAIEQARAASGALALLITHNTAIADLAHRVIRMANGRIAGVSANATRRPAREITW